MKNFLRDTKDLIVLLILGIVFLLTWPLFFIFAWIKSLFSNKVSDSTKVSITKDVVIGFGIIIIVIIISFLSQKIGLVVSPAIDSIGFWISNHWYIFLSMFVLLGLIEHLREKMKDKMLSLSCKILDIGYCGTPKIQADAINRKIEQGDDKSNPGL